MDLLDRLGQSDALPIVMISGREDAPTNVRSIDSGCVDYLEIGSLTADQRFSTVLTAVFSTFSDPSKQKEVRAATAHVMGGIARGCITELKPRQTRMYKQIAFIRACETNGVFPAAEAVNDIEEQCMNIWRFFDEVASYGESLSATRH